MKKLLALIIIGFLASCTATSKLSKSPMLYQEGDDLIYEVKTKDDDGDDIKYEIELNINGVDYYVSYDWEVFAERSGTIFMKENAIQNATKLLSFNNGGYQQLEDATTIWISRTVFKNLKANEKVEITLDESTEVFQMLGREDYNFGDELDYNIPVIIAKNADKTIELWIADDAKNPIIVQMRMKDFRMDLIDYKLFD